MIIFDTLSLMKYRESNILTIDRAAKTAIDALPVFFSVNFIATFLLAFVLVFSELFTYPVETVPQRTNSSQHSSIDQMLIPVRSGNRGTKIAKTIKNLKPPTTKRANAADTSATNRIKALKQDGNYFKLYLELENYDSPIEISVWNMLGIRVIDVHDGKPKPTDDPYWIPTYDLPDGIYLVSVKGRNFKLSDKMLVSR